MNRLLKMVRTSEYVHLVLIAAAVLTAAAVEASTLEVNALSYTTTLQECGTMHVYVCR